ncbi:MAG: SDR family NAD(P)-dependent oxidoreductase [Mycobacteriales bacterium]
MLLAGCGVLLTGATGGIGQATAIALRAAGARLALTGRDDDRLKCLVARTDGVALPVDLTQPAALEQLSREAGDALGSIDVVVHCAGQGRAAPLDALSAQEAAGLLDLNLRVPIELSRLVLPGMLAAGSGRLVLLGSIAGAVGVRDESVYAAAKAGVAAFAGSLNDELGGTGVGVTTVIAGAVATEFFDRRGRAYDRAFPRPVAPGRVAGAIVRAIERDRAWVVVPAWMHVPMRVHGAAPGLYRALSARWG